MRPTAFAAGLGQACGVNRGLRPAHAYLQTYDVTRATALRPQKQVRAENCIHEQYLTKAVLSTFFRRVVAQLACSRKYSRIS